MSSMLPWELLLILHLKREGLIGKKTLNYILLTESQRNIDILKNNSLLVLADEVARSL